MKNKTQENRKKLTLEEALTLARKVNVDSWSPAHSTVKETKWGLEANMRSGEHTFHINIAGDSVPYIGIYADKDSRGIYEHVFYERETAMCKEERNKIGELYDSICSKRYEREIRSAEKSKDSAFRALKNLVRQD